MMQIPEAQRQKLLDELVDEYKNGIPDEAITARQLADELECTVRRANDILYTKFLAGELTRAKKSEGQARIYYYWK